MLWTDKYRPKDIASLDYRQQQALDLKNLAVHGDFPHLLVYGPNGAGKKTRIMCLLRELFGPGVDRVRSETMHFTTPSNKKLEIAASCSNYHIELSPTDVGIHDRVVVMDVIKGVAQTQQVNVGAARDFKVVLLNDAERLTRDAQHALRRTMEKYVANCRIILCTSAVSSVIAPVRSRCLCVRVPAPTLAEVAAVLVAIAGRERMEGFGERDALAVAALAGRNLRQAVLMLQTACVETQAARAHAPPAEGLYAKCLREPDWRRFLKGIGDMVIRSPSVATIGEARKRLYEVIVAGIPMDVVFEVLLDKLLEFCDADMTRKLIELAARCSHNITKGNKDIVHLESFVVGFMQIHMSSMSSFE